MNKKDILKKMKQSIESVKAKNAIEDVLDLDRIAEMSSDSIPSSKQGVMSKKNDCDCDKKSKKDCECEKESPMDKTEIVVKAIIDNFKKISEAYLAKKENEKPFHNYNKEKHSKKGGLSEKERNRINREEGSNLKAPVSSKEAKKSPKKAARRKSFCARMSGVKGPTSKKGKLTPKGAALKRWDC